jgi:hypothetical protein
MIQRTSVKRNWSDRFRNKEVFGGYKILLKCACAGKPKVRIFYVLWLSIVLVAESAISLEYHAAIQHNTHPDSIILTPSRPARMMIDDWVPGMREQDGIWEHWGGRLDIGDR